MSSESSASDSDMDEEEEEAYFEVEKIVDHNFNKSENKMFYRVRWKGYPPSQDTWEPPEHLEEGCAEIIRSYQQQVEKKNSNKSAKKEGTEHEESKQKGKQTTNKQANESASDTQASRVDKSNKEGLLKAEVTESWQKINILISHLCDPDNVTVFENLEELSNRLTVISSCDSKPKHSLLTAILTSTEDHLDISEYSDINHCIPGNWTPLHFAAAMNKYDVCNKLLDSGAWPDVCTVGNLTPLILCLKRATNPKGPSAQALTRLVTKLIESGANTEYGDPDNKPLTLAKKIGNKEIVSVITAQQTRLNTLADYMMDKLLVSSAPPKLHLIDYFIKPQTITQPGDMLYKIDFKFNPPDELCVAQLVYFTVADTDEAQEPATSAELFKSFKINNKDIAITQGGSSMGSVTLKSELSINQNVLEVILNNSLSVGSLVVFGALVGADKQLPD